MENCSLLIVSLLTLYMCANSLPPFTILTAPKEWKTENFGWKNLPQSTRCPSKGSLYSPPNIYNYIYSFVLNQTLTYTNLALTSILLHYLFHRFSSIRFKLSIYIFLPCRIVGSCVHQESREAIIHGNGSSLFCICATLFSCTNLNESIFMWELHCCFFSYSYSHT